MPKESLSAPTDEDVDHLDVPTLRAMDRGFVQGIDPEEPEDTPQYHLTGFPDSYDCAL